MTLSVTDTITKLLFFCNIILSHLEPLRKKTKSFATRVDASTLMKFASWSLLFVGATPALSCSRPICSEKSWKIPQGRKSRGLKTLLLFGVKILSSYIFFLSFLFFSYLCFRLAEQARKAEIRAARMHHMEVSFRRVR